MNNKEYIKYAKERGEVIKHPVYIAMKKQLRNNPYTLDKTHSNGSNSEDSLMDTEN